MCNPSSWSDLTFCNDFHPSLHSLSPPPRLLQRRSFLQCSLPVEGSSIPRQDETTHPRNYPISGEKTPRYPAGCWYMGRCSPRFPITRGRGWPNSHLRPSLRAKDELSSSFGSCTPSRIGEFSMIETCDRKFFRANFTRFHSFCRARLVFFESSQTWSDCVFEIKFESTFISLGRKEGLDYSIRLVILVREILFTFFSLNGKFIFFPSLH